MKNKTEKDFIKWIKETIDYYLPKLFININKIEIEKGEETRYLEITCTYPYLDPTLKYSERAFNAWIKGKIKKDRILHEICHILTDPLYSKANDRFSGKNEIEDERERLTDTLASILIQYI
jgi:hypothetical protein